MADFDPDAYLAKKQAPQGGTQGAVSGVAKSFDPDAYLAKKQAQPDSPGILSKINDAAVNAYSYLQNPQDPRIGLGLLGGLKQAGRAVDYAMDAPFRVGLEKSEQGKYSEIPDAVISQYGKSPEDAPSVRDVFTKPVMGMVGANPDDYPRVSKAVDFAGSAAQPSSLFLGSAINVAGKAASKGLGLLESGPLSRAAEAISGAPKTPTKAYLNDTSGVNNMIEKYAGNTTERASDISKMINQKISSYKQGLSGQINASLDGSKQLVPMGDVISGLEQAKASVNNVYGSKDIALIDEQIGKMQKLMDANGNMSVRNANDTKEALQGLTSYKPNGAIFIENSAAQRAAKAAARQTRLLVNQASPEIAQANNQYQLLHSIEDNMNRNILNPDKAEPGLLAAGMSDTGKNRKQLDQLSSIVGVDLNSEAEKLAAMKIYSKPSFTPVTGSGTTSTSRSMVGGAIGAKAGYALGGPEGAAVGLAAGNIASSPAVVKALVNISKYPRESFIPALQDIAEAVGRDKIVGKGAVVGLKGSDFAGKGLLAGKNAANYLMPKATGDQQGK